MRRIIESVLVLVVLASVAAQTAAQASSPSAGASGADTIYVAPPTSERETDRASILAALDEVEPGGMVRFAPGTYLVGEIIRVTVPRVTLLGHPDGTTLRGCDPAAYEEMERDAAAAGEDWRARFDAVRRCGMFELMGGHATVRGFTFEYTRMGLILGCCHAEREARRTEGGYHIEGNTFRNSGNGIRPGLLSAEPTVIRGNRFINTFHAISAFGGHLHVLDNDISVPEPERVPGVGHPSFAISFCGDHNLVVGNRIEGHPDGIEIFAWADGCRHNVIRDNTIAVRRVPLPKTRPYPDLARVTDVADSTIVGVPLLLINERGEVPLKDNLIEGNRFLGGEGIAVELSGGTRNRILNNTFYGIRVRDPFPGNVLGALPAWEIANGSAIWLSPGSDENEIVGNTFEDVAGAAVFVEGDRNVVITRSAGDEVRDRGRENRVTARTEAPFPDGSPDSEETAVRRALDAYFSAFKARDTARIKELTTPGFVLYEGGFPVERSRWTEAWDPAEAASSGRQQPEHRFRDVEIDVLGDVASLSYLLEWLQDGEVSIRGRETGLARKLDGSWRFARFHSTWFPPVRPLGPDALDDYVGTYRRETLDLSYDLIVRREGQRLYMLRDDGGTLVGGLVRLQLFPEAEDRFYLEVTTDRVVMRRDSTGDVAGMTVHPSVLWGEAFRWVRVEDQG